MTHRLAILKKTFSLLGLVLLLLNQAQPALAVVHAGQPADLLSQASAVLEGLTPEERVGQLFLITFEGSDVGPGAKIQDFISQYHVGGVVLLAAHDNFIYTGASNNETVDQAYSMIRQLQGIDWNASRSSQINPATGEEFAPTFIPLFIGMSQEGNGYPYDQILNGLTPLPNEMALGATWKPDLADQVGSVLGKELSLLGVNLLLGPSLDVLETPQLETNNNLGTRVFGGDPYWVGEMGRAYIRGIHTGSSGRVAVVAKHFPGHGSSDRLPEVEVATVRKSLDELEAFDLAPFFTVTGNAAAPEEVADALLASHIRYQGLQGNIRATTRPVSLDPQAFSLLMGLPPLDAWRKNGGLMVSDDLGGQAIRRFYDLTSQTFDARRVAVNAFLAGNDVLYFSDFSSADDLDTDSAAVRTLDFFAQKYREDAAFAQRVDESVLRILELKLRLYRNFNLGDVLASQGSLDEIGKSSQVTFDVARQAGTLISPSQQDLDVSIPDPPNQNDRIVFISDTRTNRQCSQCPEFDILGKRTLQDAVIRLYGPSAGGQVTTSALSSYSLDDLQAMLDDTQPDLPLESDLLRSNWIVISMLTALPDKPSYRILSRFLSERPDLFLQKRLIVFAFSEPYFLDATNISKLTAFYGLYDVSAPFIDVAAYLLFRELPPTGSLPVSVPGVSYDLNAALFPDPDQEIPLQLDLPVTEQPQGILTPEPTPAPQFHLGDSIPLRTGVILDYNGHAVPDGTPVTFVLSTGLEATTVRQVATTQDGVAQTQFLVASSGTLEIYAESERARSLSLTFDIPLPPGESLTENPTTEPTLTDTPSPTETLTQPPPTVPVQAQSTDPGLGEWIIAVLLSGIVALSAYRLAALLGQIRWGVRIGFLALIGGLVAYSYLALGLPGSQPFLENSLSWSVFIFTLTGAALGIIAALSWRLVFSMERRRNAHQDHETPPSPHQGKDQAQQQQSPRNPE
jgi:beta-N-acetylhexosaminidase